MTFSSKKEFFLFYSLPAILFSLIPLFLITGPFLSDFSISFIVIFFLIYCIKKKNFSYFKNRYFYFFLIFWIYLILNSLINNFNIDSLKISFFYFRYGVFIIAMVSLIEFDEKIINFFFYCILLCFAALIIDGFYQYFIGENIFGWKNISGYRVSSFFGDELILGSYLSRLWPIFFGLSIYLFRNKDKLFFLFILIFILSEVLIFLSGERVAFFYINLSAIFVILFSRKLLKLRLITLGISLMIIVLVSLMYPAAKERVINQTINQMNLFNDNKKENNGPYIFSKQHTHHYISAYRMFLDNKILGVGVKNFRNFCNKEKYLISNVSCSTHPHNSYIQVLAELGIIGFLFLILVLASFCYAVIKHFFYKLNKTYYFNDFEICILSGILIFLWPLVPTGNIFNNWLNIIMILNLVFFIWSRKKTII
jgi:O-antigen ligase